MKEARHLVRAVVLAAAGTAFAALPTAEQKAVFRETPAWTASIELVSQAARGFDPDPGPETSSDQARFARKSLALSIVLDRPVALDDLVKHMSLTKEEKAQAGRFVGWEAIPAPDSPGNRRGTTGPSRNPAKDPGMMPVRFAVESIEQHKGRRLHGETDPWFVTTTTTIGQGEAWLERRALLLCDLTRVACELRLPVEFEDGDDDLSVTMETNEAGAAPQIQMRGPAPTLQYLVRDPFAVLERFEFDLPAPIAKEFKWSPRGVDPQEEKTILKLTLDPAKAAAKPRSN